MLEVLITLYHVTNGYGGVKMRESRPAPRLRYACNPKEEV